MPGGFNTGSYMHVYRWPKDKVITKVVQQAAVAATLQNPKSPLYGATYRQNFGGEDAHQAHSGGGMEGVVNLLRNNKKTLLGG